MEQLIVVLVMAALLGLGTWFQYRLSNRRMWHPLRLAFTTTLGALLFLVTGVVGYRLSQPEMWLAGSRWADGVLWWQVGLGIVFAALAVLFWRIAIRETDRLITQRSAR